MRKTGGDGEERDRKAGLCSGKTDRRVLITGSTWKTRSLSLYLSSSLDPRAFGCRKRVSKCIVEQEGRRGEREPSLSPLPSTLIFPESSSSHTYTHRRDRKGQNGHEGCALCACVYFMLPSPLSFPPLSLCVNARRLCSAQNSREFHSCDRVFRA